MISISQKQLYNISNAKFNDHVQVSKNTISVIIDVSISVWDHDGSQAYIEIRKCLKRWGDTQNLLEMSLKLQPSWRSWPTSGRSQTLWNQQLNQHQATYVLLDSYQVLPSGAFGGFKWPFQGLSDLHLGDQKVTWKKLVLAFSLSPTKDKTWKNNE